MEVTLITRIHGEYSEGHKAGSVHDVQASISNFCCEEMKKAWFDEFINLGDKYSKTYPNSKLSIHKNYDDSVPINVCPFCAELITYLQGDKKVVIPTKVSHTVTHIVYMEVQ